MAETVAVRLAVERAEEATARLRSFGDAGEKAFQRVGAAGVFTSVQTRGALQNVGFQVQDLIVQLEAGTPPLRAFIQQGGQILQIFGPMGAAAAVAAVGVGAVFAAFSSSNRETARAPALLDSVGSSFGVAAGEADKMAEALRTATEEGRRLLQTFADIDRQTALKSAGEALGDIGDVLRGRIETRVQEANFDRLQGIVPEKRGQQIAAIGRLAGIQSSNITGQLRSAIESGDPEAVRKILNDAEVVTDDASAELAKQLIDAAQKIQLAGLVSEGNQSALEAIGAANDKPASSGGGGSRRSARDPVADAAEQFAAFKREVAGSVANAERLALAAQDSADAYERAKIAEEARSEVERAVEGARRAGLEISQEEASTLEAQLVLAQQLRDTAQETVRARKEAQAEYEREFQRAQADADRAQQGVEEDERREAERQARDRARPFEAAFDQAARNIQDSLANAINNAFAGEIGSVQEFADELVGVFRGAAANIAALAIFDPEKFGELTGKVFGEEGKALTAANFAQGVGLGVGAGTTLSGLVGGNSTGSLVGSGIGSALGAAVGSGIGPIGTVLGGVIGGAAGGLFGGLFGGGGGGNNRAGSSINIGTGRLSLGNDVKSAANQQIVDRIVTGLSSVVDFIESVGGNLPNQQFRVRVGDKSGADLTIGGRQFSFDSPEELTVAAIRKIVKAADDVPRDVRRAARFSDATTADQLIEDINFGASFADLIKQTTPLKAEFEALERTFDSAAKKAKELGLDEAALAAARADATGRFLEEVERGFNAIVNPGTIFKQQLDAITVQFDEAARLAKDFGLSEREVEEGRTRAINELMETAKRSIQDLVNPGTIFKQQLEAIKVEFDEAAKVAAELGLSEAEVQAGRERAIAELTQAATRSVNDLITPSTNLKRELNALQLQFDEAAKVAKEFGLDEQAVAAARARASAEVRDAARDAFQSVVNPASDFRRQLDALNASFDDALQLARDFGFSEQAVSQARQKAIQDLADTSRSALNQIIDPAAGFLAQLEALSERFDEASRLARDLGVNERVVADARARAIQDLLSEAEEALLDQRERIVATFDGLLDPIRGTIEALQFGNLTAASPQEQLAQAQAAFREQLRLAQGGNEDAIRALPDLARTFATEAREFNASGRIFQDAFREINEGLNGVLDAGERRQQDILSQLPDSIARANRGVIDAVDRQTRDIVNEVQALRRAIENGRLPA